MRQTLRRACAAAATAAATDAFRVALTAGALVVAGAPSVRAAASSSGDVAPTPPAGGGYFPGALRVGDVGVGTMSITGGTEVSHGGAAFVGSASTGIGIANISGLGSSWVLTTPDMDMFVGAGGTGTVNLSNLAFLGINDDLFVGALPNSLGRISLSSLGTIVDVGDDAFIGQRGQGIIEVSGGARLAITAGSVDVFGPVTNGAGAAIVVGGTAVATFHGAVANHGTIHVQPGGKVLMLEDLAFGGGSSLRVQLAPGALDDPDADPLLSHGQIDVAGPAKLGGGLHLALADGRRPAEGTVFPILSSDSLTGRFDSITGFDLGEGLYLRPVYDPGGLSLVVTQAGPGDADDHVLIDRGFVLGLAAWRNGDFNHDGAVDAADYHLIDRAFATQGGPPAAAAPSAAVPEPATGLLVLAASASCHVAVATVTRGRCSPRAQGSGAPAGS